MESDHIVWLDTELTDLLLEGYILEIACVITDKNLNPLCKDLNIVINLSDSMLENMNEWYINFHTKNGLIKESKCSTINVNEAEQILLDFLKEHNIPAGQCPLAGNTIYIDRLFLKKYMPKVDEYFHYRVIDVSSIKELVRRWNPQIYKNIPNKLLHHRALPDVKESIQELTYYKDNLFLPPKV